MSMQTPHAPFKELVKQLRPIMQREVSCLRDILSNMREEQECLIANNTTKLAQVVNHRENFVESSLDLREQRKKILSSMFKIMNIQDKESKDQERIFINKLAHQEGEETCLVLSCKEQLLSLMEALRIQNERNSYLIEQKIIFNKDLLNQIYSKEENSIYGKKGSKKQTQTITLINKEG